MYGTYFYYRYEWVFNVKKYDPIFIRQIGLFRFRKGEEEFNKLGLKRFNKFLNYKTPLFGGSLFKTDILPINLNSLVHHGGYRVTFTIMYMRFAVV